MTKPQVMFAEDTVIASGTDEFGEYRTQLLFGVHVNFRLIKSGVFVQGHETKNAKKNKETSMHSEVTQDCWMMDTTVTQEFWKAVMGNNPSSNKDSLQNPVETVSWADTQNLIHRLNSVYPNLNIALPTSTVWEKACKGGTRGVPFYTGDTISGKDANFKCSMKDAYNPEPMPARGSTAPVKSYPPNQFGLYEMHGNVWEWCADVYKPVDYSVPDIPDDGTGDPITVTKDGDSVTYAWRDFTDVHGNPSRVLAKAHVVEKDHTYGWHTDAEKRLIVD